MSNQGTESQFEETTIDRLRARGYRYQYGGDLERDWQDVVMADWLRAFLKKKYPKLPSDALEEAIVKASRPEGITTEQRNKNFHTLLTRGFEQKYRKPDGTETFEHIYVVDWEKAGANDFCIVNQLTIRGANDRRPDIIIYLNGFPIVLFELKNPYEEQPNTLGAFNQVQHYKVGISQLFDYNALVVVSDGGLVGHADDDTPHAVGATLHGMWTATWEWFAPWKSINGRDVVESATGAMKTLIEGLFPPERLLDYLRHFIAFEVVNEKIEKKGAKYHQYFGVRFAVEEAFRATQPDGDRKIGVIWHTQGSGKSLSMAYFVAILRHDPRMENPTFVIQVDSTDIDDQLHDQFVAVKTLVGDVQHAGFRELRSLLRGDAGEVVFSTIQKFQLGEKEAKDEHKARAVRDLLDRSIESKGVVDIFAAAGIAQADISILDEKFLEEFKSHEQENLRLKLLAKILADEIRVREKTNLAKYRSFKEMLEQNLLKYHNRAIQAADVVRVMIEIRKDMDSEAARSKALNLSPEEIAFYDAVVANVAALFDEKTLCDLIRDVVQTVKKNLKVDWTKPHREDVKAGVRAAVKTVLRKRGVKKELLDALTDKVIVQAEALFKEWPLAA